MDFLTARFSCSPRHPRASLTSVVAAVLSLGIPFFVSSGVLAQSGVGQPSVPLDRGTDIEDQKPGDWGTLYDRIPGGRGEAPKPDFFLEATTTAIPDPGWRLESPVQCDLNTECFQHRYMDLKAGAGVGDYRCGSLTENGYDSSAIRLRDATLIGKPVPVRAMAAGTVVRVRSGFRDRSTTADRQSERRRRTAARTTPLGNHLEIDHGDGWSSRYANLQDQSISVRVGQRVRAGQEIGAVGASGRVDFPQVAFRLTWRGKPVDPFSGRDGSGGCDGDQKPLWSAGAQRAMRYVDTALMATGFAGTRPKSDRVRFGGVGDGPGGDPEALVYWVDVAGLQTGDRQVLRLLSPTGRVLREVRFVVPRPKTEWLGFVGQARPPEGWPSGRYRAEYELIRMESTVSGVRARAIVQMNKAHNIR